MIEANPTNTNTHVSDKFEVIDTGGGSLAWYLKDARERPNHYVLVTTEDGMHVPDEPETDALLIGLYADDSGDTLQMLELCGRAELNDWYLQHVGYRPDEDAGEQTPIESLIYQVATMFLLHNVSE